eukprot:3071954-Amphidinium_carterae.1
MPYEIGGVNTNCCALLCSDTLIPTNALEVLVMMPCLQILCKRGTWLSCMVNNGHVNICTMNKVAATSHGTTHRLGNGAWPCATQGRTQSSHRWSLCEPHCEVWQDYSQAA